MRCRARRTNPGCAGESFQRRNRVAKQREREREREIGMYVCLRPAEIPGALNETGKKGGKKNYNPAARAPGTEPS